MAKIKGWNEYAASVLIAATGALPILCIMFPVLGSPEPFITAITIAGDIWAWVALGWMGVWCVVLWNSDRFFDYEGDFMKVIE